MGRNKGPSTETVWGSPGFRQNHWNLLHVQRAEGNSVWEVQCENVVSSTKNQWKSEPVELKKARWKALTASRGTRVQCPAIPTVLTVVCSASSGDLTPPSGLITHQAHVVHRHASKAPIRTKKRSHVGILVFKSTDSKIKTSLRDFHQQRKNPQNWN